MPDYASVVDQTGDIDLYLLMRSLIDSPPQSEAEVTALITDLLPDAALIGVLADNGDVGKTLTAGVDLPTQRWATALTGVRTVTLATAGAYLGAKFRIVRAPTATGSTLNVGTGPLKALAVSEWADVEYSGTAWVLTAFGGL